MQKAQKLSSEESAWSEMKTDNCQSSATNCSHQDSQVFKKQPPLLCKIQKADKHTPGVSTVNPSARVPCTPEGARGQSSSESRLDEIGKGVNFVTEHN